LDEVTRFVDQGGITIPLERTYALESAGEALALLNMRAEVEQTLQDLRTGRFIRDEPRGE
jgi:hypothetical protein